MPPVIAAIVFSLLTVSRDSVQVPTPIPSPDTAQAIAFLEFVKNGESAEARARGFDVAEGGHWDNPRFIRFLDPGGVTFFDTNGDTTWHLSPARIRAQLARRSGTGYAMVVHLGHIYGQREPQYSKLTFAADSEGVRVTVGSWYRLTFVRRGQRLRLAKIEYVMKEDT